MNRYFAKNVFQPVKEDFVAVNLRHDCFDGALDGLFVINQE